MALLQPLKQTCEKSRCGHNGRRGGRRRGFGASPRRQTTSERGIWGTMAGGHLTTSGSCEMRLAVLLALSGAQTSGLEAARASTKERRTAEKHPRQAPNLLGGSRWLAFGEAPIKRRSGHWTPPARWWQQITWKHVAMSPFEDLVSSFERTPVTCN